MKAMASMRTAERVKHVLARPSAGGAVTVRGWLRTARHGKGVSFLELTDGSCLAGLQVVAEPALAELRERGAALAHRLRGRRRRASSSTRRAAGQRFELRAARVELVGEVGDDYPLQKKRHSFEFLRTIAHLRAAHQHARRGAARAQRRRARDPPTSSTSAASSGCTRRSSRPPTAEGAGAMFRVTTLDPARRRATPDGRVDFAQDFFGREAFLTVSGQLEAEIGALALAQRLHLRPDLPRRELEHQPPPRRVLDGRARDGLLRSRRRHGARRGLPEAPCCATLLEALPGGHGVLRRAHRARACVATLEHVVATPFERMTYTEAVARPRAQRARPSSSRSSGDATCRASTSAG